MKSLIVFAKAPVKGEVKTRLKQNTPLSDNDLVVLYTAFLKDTLVTAGKSSADKIIINYTPAESEELMRNLAEEFVGSKDLDFIPQEGNGFSERIKSSFDHARQSGSKISIMTGSDSPTLQSTTIDDAFDLIEKRGGCVLGPSGEGGIYLIGMESRLSFDYEKIFSNGSELINFSLEVKRAGGNLSLLGEVSDIDVASDLVTLLSLVGSMKLAGEDNFDFPFHTAQELSRLGLSVERSEGTREKMVVKNG